MREPSIKELPGLPLLDVQAALVSVRPEWERLSDNYQLSMHLADMQKLLSLCRSPVCSDKQIDDEPNREWYTSWKPATSRLSMHDLLYRPLKEMPAAESNVHAQRKLRQSQSASRLREIVSKGKSV